MKKNSFVYKHYLAALTLLSFLSGCMGKRNFVQKMLFMQSAKREQDKQPNSVIDQISEQPIVTIWIHGTKGILKRFRRINQVARFFTTLDGLRPIEDLDESMHHRLIGEALIESDPKNCTRGHVYLFGWSGTLSFEAREQAAHDLRIELDRLIQKYQTSYNYTPKIRIITHSHGGNVALNLAAIKNDYGTNFVIEELILLACPVQDQTEPYTQDPLFKHIYSFYSNRDLFQIFDPQGAYPDQKDKAQSFLSRRRFKPHGNITQVKIKINQRALSHVEFMMNRFIRMIPYVMVEINSWDKTTRTMTDIEQILSIYTHNHKHRLRLKQ